MEPNNSPLVPEGLQILIEILILSDHAKRMAILKAKLEKVKLRTYTDYSKDILKEMGVDDEHFIKGKYLVYCAEINVVKNNSAI